MTLSEELEKVEITPKQILIKLDVGNVLKIVSMGSLKNRDAYSVMIDESAPFWEEYAAKKYVASDAVASWLDSRVKELKEHLCQRRSIGFPCPNVKQCNHCKDIDTVFGCERGGLK